MAQHLCLVEELTLAQMRTPLDPARSTRTLRQRLGGLVVWALFTVGIRVRIPTRRVAPEPSVPFEESAARWLRAGAGIRELALEVTEPDRPVMVHPVSGPLTTKQALDFLLIHLRQHRRQLRRIMAHPGFPTSTPTG